MTDDSSLWRLLDHYLAGELAPAERERFERWVAQSPERQAWVASLRRITRETTQIHPMPTAGTDSAWLRISRRLSLRPRDAVAPIEGDRSTLVGEGHAARASATPRLAWGRSYARAGSRRRRAIAGAFAVSLVLIVSVLIVRELPRQAVQPKRFDTGIGERETVTLSDGTQFVLAPASVVTVDAAYGRSSRIVTLDGEASFTVAHDARRPFSVRTPWATVRDVGTRFVVRAYSDDRRTQVGVREGAVSVIVPGHTTPTATLRAAGSATVDALGHVALGTVRDDDALLAWTQGEIVFQDTPFADAVRDLGRSFNLQIQIADTSLAHLPITATFTAQPVDVVLDDITAIVGASYQRSGRAVVIHRRARGEKPRRAEPK